MKCCNNILFSTNIILERNITLLQRNIFSGSQFYQHFTSRFSANLLGPKCLNLNCKYINAARLTFVQKKTFREMLVKLTIDLRISNILFSFWKAKWFHYCLQFFILFARPQNISFFYSSSPEGIPITDIFFS